MTIRPASVGFIVGVKRPIITSFDSGDDPITAGRLSAVVVAAICVDVVLVIAFFESIDDTIAAIGQGWVGAVIWARAWTVGIKWVTIFRCVLNAITAER